jgi:hypothetical protein
MTYERVRYVTITDPNEGTAHEAFTTYTDQAIDGRLYKIAYIRPFPSALGPYSLGSIFITVSGWSGTNNPPETLFRTNATIVSSLGSSWFVYPRAFCSTLSGTPFDIGSWITCEPVCRDSVIKTWVSGLSMNAGSKFGMIRIFYY